MTLKSAQHGSMRLLIKSLPERAISCMLLSSADGARAAGVNDVHTIHRPPGNLPCLSIKPSCLSFIPSDNDAKLSKSMLKQ